MTVLRKPLLTVAGEGLIVASSALDMANRLPELADFAGIDDSFLLTSPMCAVPLPLYGDIPEGQRRWTGTRPEAMWHPLMWLPERLALRYRLGMVGDEVWDETDPVWAILSGLELTASGLYDQASCGWLDILAAVNLDIIDPPETRRAHRSLGVPGDEILDDIDLSNYLDLDDRDWGLESALGLQEDLEVASWGLLASDLTATMTEMAGESGQFAVGDLKSVIVTVLNLAEVSLAEMPVAEGAPTLEQFCADTIAFVEAFPVEEREAFAVEVVAPVRDWLASIVDAYWPKVEQMKLLGAEGEPAPV